MKKAIGLLFFSFFFSSLIGQQKTILIIEAGDTINYELYYESLDSTNNKLTAFFKHKQTQVALEKSYFIGKQSGLTKSYFPNGTVYEASVYQKGQRNGDFSRYNSLGELVIKAQYRDNVLSGFFIDKQGNFQGKYLNGLKDGKWEFNVGSPDYYKEYYKRGEIIEKRQIFPSLKVKRIKKENPQKNRIKSKEDSLLIPYNGDTVWYQLNYVAQDLLEHPAMRKAFFVSLPNVVAHTKYIYNGFVNGMYKIYYPNGKLYLFANYTASYLDGAWKEYDELGNLRIKGKYLDGLKVGKWKYGIGTAEYRIEKYRAGVLKK